MKSLGTRTVTISHQELRAIRRLVVVEDEQDEQDEQPARPKTRGDCQDGPRPCPWVGCRYHLFSEVTATGSLKFRHPHLAVDELSETCVLDVADRAGESREVISTTLNLTVERVRQIEVSGLENLKRLMARKTH